MPAVINLKLRHLGARALEFRKGDNLLRVSFVSYLRSLPFWSGGSQLIGGRAQPGSGMSNTLLAHEGLAMFCVPRDLVSKERIQGQGSRTFFCQEGPLDEYFLQTLFLQLSILGFPGSREPGEEHPTVSACPGHPLYGSCGGQTQALHSQAFPPCSPEPAGRAAE